jgi:hypothetical protein
MDLKKKKKKKGEKSVLFFPTPSFHYKKSRKKNKKNIKLFVMSEEREFLQVLLT